MHQISSLLQPKFPTISQDLSSFLNFLEKSEVPGATFNICLPLADIKRLSEDFVSAKYERFNAESNVND